MAGTLPLPSDERVRELVKDVSVTIERAQREASSRALNPSFGKTWIKTPD